MQRTSRVFQTAFAIFFATHFTGCSSSHDLDKELEANQIMNAVKTAYRECSTYQDQGIQTERHRVPDSAYRVTNTFYLRFDRSSDSLAFAYFSAGRSYLVLMEQGTVQTIDSDDAAPETQSDLMSALHIGNGVSQSTALLIPCLLAPQQVNRSSFWGYVKSLVRLDDELIDGIPHYRLSGYYYGKDGTVDFWIDRDFQIRKIVTYEPSVQDLERTWEFQAKLDQPLPSEPFSTEKLIALAPQEQPKPYVPADASDPDSPGGLLKTVISSRGDEREQAIEQFRALKAQSIPTLLEFYLAARPYAVEPGMHPQGYDFLLLKILHGLGQQDAPLWDEQAEQAMSAGLIDLLDDSVSWRRLQAAQDLSILRIPLSDQGREQLLKTLGTFLDSDVRLHRRQALIILANLVEKWPDECSVFVPRITELAESEVYAVSCLEQLGPRAASALPTLKRLNQKSQSSLQRELYEKAIKLIESPAQD